MNSPSAKLLRGAGVTLLALTMATAARADLFNRERPAPAPRRAPTFEVAGVYTGMLTGQVVIDGGTYALHDPPQIHQVGTGAIALLDLPIGTRVYASGTMVGGTGTIRMLIARPSSEKDDGGDMSSHVLVLDRANMRK